MGCVVINPNSTVSMTDAMAAVMRGAAPELAFEGWTSQDGPAAIQGHEDGLVAVGPMLELVKRASDADADGIVIGCFDDTGLAEAARIATCPVVGLGQATYHFAAMRNWRFSVVTTLSVSVPVLEENIRTMGLAPYLGRVRASEVPVLELEANPEKAGQAVLREAQKAEAADNVDAIVLGCAGMVQVVRDVRATLGIETIDPVVCAAQSLRWLIRS